MNKPKPYTAAEIRADIEELDRLDSDLIELAKKYKSNSIGNKMIMSFFNQNLRKTKELQEKLMEC